MRVGNRVKRQTQDFKPDVKTCIEKSGDAEHGAVSPFVEGLLGARVDSCGGLGLGTEIIQGLGMGSHPRYRSARGPRARCSFDIGLSDARALPRVCVLGELALLSVVLLAGVRETRCEWKGDCPNALESSDGGSWRKVSDTSGCVVGRFVPVISMPTGSGLRGLRHRTKEESNYGGGLIWQTWLGIQPHTGPQRVDEARPGERGTVGSAAAGHGYNRSYRDNSEARQGPLSSARRRQGSANMLV